MESTVRAWICAWILLVGWCVPSLADGGALRLSGTKGGYRIAVFTAPTPFRVGAVDLSVLVQDAATGAPMPHLPVTVRMSKVGSRPLEYPATAEAATNKLFRAARFELPAVGRWELQVRVEGESGQAEIGGEVDAAEAMPRWREVWPWFTWPVLAVVLFVVHQLALRSRKPGEASDRDPPSREIRRPADKT